MEKCAWRVCSTGCARFSIYGLAFGSFVSTFCFLEYDGKKWRMWHIIFYLFSIGCCILPFDLLNYFEKCSHSSLHHIFSFSRSQQQVFVCECMFAFRWSGRRWMMVSMCMNLLLLFFLVCVHLNVWRILWPTETTPRFSICPIIKLSTTPE